MKVSRNLLLLVLVVLLIGLLIRSGVPVVAKQDVGAPETEHESLIKNREHDYIKIMDQRVAAGRPYFSLGTISDFRNSKRVISYLILRLGDHPLPHRWQAKIDDAVAKGEPTGFPNSGNDPWFLFPDQTVGGAGLLAIGESATEQMIDEYVRYRRDKVKDEWRIWSGVQFMLGFKTFKEPALASLERRLKATPKNEIETWKALNELLADLSTTSMNPQMDR